VPRRVFSPVSAAARMHTYVGRSERGTVRDSAAYVRKPAGCRKRDEWPLDRICHPHQRYDTTHFMRRRSRGASGTPSICDGTQA
jgi:hypothetical protein